MKVEWTEWTKKPITSTISLEGMHGSNAFRTLNRQMRDSNTSPDRKRLLQRMLPNTQRTRALGRTPGAYSIRMSNTRRYALLLLGLSNHVALCLGLVFLEGHIGVLTASTNHKRAHHACQ